MRAPRDFLSLYLEYTRENEAPELFHFWSMVAMLGHVLNRRVWVDQHINKIYPGQIMVCLVSPSAISRKTTAINMAVELVCHLPEENLNLIEGAHSVAMLYEALDRGLDQEGQPMDSIGIVVADELGVFLSKETFQDQMTTTITQLNTCRDGPVIRRMRVATTRLWNVTLGMLAGTTPTGIAHEIPKTAQKAGFFGRVLWINEAQSDRCNPLTEPPRNMRPLRDALVTDLYRMQRLQGAFDWTPDGKVYYEKWYKEYFRRGQLLQADSMASGFYGRKAQHILRLAMVMQACRSNRLLLTTEMLVAATGAIELIETQIAETHSEIGTSRHVAQQERVLQLLGIARNGRLSHTALYSKLWRHIPPTELNVVMQGLIQAQLVQMHTNGDKSVGYTVVRTRGDMLRRVHVETRVTDDEKAREME